MVKLIWKPQIKKYVKFNVLKGETMNSISSIECKTCHIKMRFETKTTIDINVKNRVMEKTFYKCPNCGKQTVQRRIIFVQANKKK